MCIYIYTQQLLHIYIYIYSCLVDLGVIGLLCAFVQL